MKIADFTHTCLSHITIISYPSRPSSHSSPPLLQPSKHPILQWGLAECAERSAAPRVGVLDSRSEGTCQFFFVSSSFCFHLQALMPSTFCFNHSLQFFALFLALLEGFFSPPYPPHRPAHSAKPITLEPFFMFFCVFLPSFFLLYFRLVFLSIFGDFEAARGSQNQAKIGEKLLRKRFFG